MKLTYPEIDHVFDTDAPMINTLVIENQDLFCRILSDIQSQIAGYEGNCVVSIDNRIVQISKYVECLDHFVPFDINRKQLINKVTAELEILASADDYYSRSRELLGQIELWLNDLAFNLTGDVAFQNISIGSVVRAVGVHFSDDYLSLAEKIIDYMELVNHYERKKLFILVNLRSFICDKDMELFLETCLQHQFHVLCIETTDRNRLAIERRCIIDKDLCEIIC